MSLFSYHFSGSYAQFSCIPANRAVPVPEGLSLDVAASSMVQGMTAHYMVKSVGQLKPGVSVLIHAVAGGTGSFLCQAAKHAGIMDSHPVMGSLYTLYGIPTK